MQTPIRKGGLHTHLKPDPYITQSKAQELQNKLDQLFRVRPQAIDEVKRLAEMGDFSENAAYQMAKGRLRGINQKIDDIQNHLKSAIIINKTDINMISIGNQVTIQVNGKQKIYQILGSSETDPSKGVISHNSPIGSALLGKKINDIVKIKINERDFEYKIIKID